MWMSNCTDINTQGLDGGEGKIYVKDKKHKNISHRHVDKRSEYFNDLHTKRINIYKK
jgi:hypothetical protein